MQNIPDEQRTARFICVMVYMRHHLDPTPLIAQGVWEGRILQHALGNNGFGYDPVFWVEDHQCSSAQLPPELKNAISHRSLALQALTRQIIDLQ
jgi:XTP/dITP diphosphohydrolase